ncbi:uncharacterized protein LOC105218663, partial [Zeugodacus cucurbitae]|uniref:uncharacterized protein LOC105218663 n=1 Tax=Zeugodacus cucurbitae TaxID=28588 RepID=UPI0023D8E616
KLIEFMSRNQFLYDKSHRNYKNTSLRDGKFQELSEKLNIPGKSLILKLMTRWRTLRDKFYKDMKKKPSRSCVDSPHKNRKWLDSLMFLKDVEMDNMNTQSNYGQEIVEGDDFFLSDFGESLEKKIKIEELIESSHKNFKRVTSLAEALLMGSSEKSAIQLFFESLAKQAEGANLTSLEMSELQLQMTQSFHQFLVNISK